MKKLMFMLAAAAMAATSQAASVYWTAKDVQTGANNGTMVSGIAYFIDSDMLSQDEFKALNGAAAFNTALSGFYSYQGTDGAFSIGKNDSIDNSNLGLDDGKDYNVYLAIFDTATITDSSNYFLTDVAALSTLAGANDKASVKWGDLYDASGTATWSPAKAGSGGGGTSGGDAPEPTSGLLLLVGGAMLALRRKQK